MRGDSLGLDLASGEDGVPNLSPGREELFAEGWGLASGEDRMLPQVREEEQDTQGGRSSEICTLKEVRCVTWVSWCRPLGPTSPLLLHETDSHPRTSPRAKTINKG